MTYFLLLDHPSPPTFFTADFDSLTCSGDVIFSWTPGTSDRAIERYILYENGDQIATTSHTNSYSFSNTLENNRDYTYSIKAETCAGRSSATSSNVISIRGGLIYITTHIYTLSVYEVHFPLKL